MKEDNANLVLNSNQLDLVYVGLKLEVLTVGFTLGALLTGKLPNLLIQGHALEENDGICFQMSFFKFADHHSLNQRLGTFGMNLKSGAEETEWAFLIAAAVIVTACSAAVLVGWVYVRKIARNF
jgi:hypothetical protein